MERRPQASPATSFTKGGFKDKLYAIYIFLFERTHFPMRADFHVHSTASLDSVEPMANSVQAAIHLGLSAICFTDHLDLIDGNMPGKRTGAESLSNWERGYAQIEQCRADFGDQIEIFHGMELGEIPQDPDFAEAALSMPGLDFVIGSIHALTGIPDFYVLDYPDYATCLSLARAYVDENILLAAHNCFDVLAHIGFINRYMAPVGHRIEFMMFEEQLRHLFKLLIEGGRGIELNTSGLRQGIGAAFPDLAMLQLYRECGGEIVTVGSDAHRASDVGQHLDEAYALLKAAGFQYQTIFRKRQPIFIPL